MHRFYLPPEACRDSLLTLTDREAHHALHVLRMKPGERLAVLNGAGSEFHCDVHKLSRDSVSLTVVEKKFIPPLPYRITLVQAIPKAKIIEAIIQKATELGVHCVVPLLSERTALRLDDESGVVKRERWQMTAIEAIKQCGNPWLPKIETPLTPGEFLARGEKFELPLVASLHRERHHPRQYFQAFHDEHERMPNVVCVWIGPEGDFTPEEISDIQAAGARPITLGPLVLRSETAAVYCLSILNYELQSPNSGKEFRATQMAPG
jgi:16S rRNA (uracil1498-N3)-methyltransferase